MAVAPMARRGGFLPIVPIAAGILALAVVVVLGAYLYERARSETIAKGVSVDGVSVGGLERGAAQRKVDRLLVGRLERPVRVRWRGREWTLSGRQAAVRVDGARMVEEAVRDSREGSFLTRAFRDLFGGSVKREVALAATYSHAAVKALTAEVRASVNRPARDASVEPNAGGLRAVPGHDGVSVDSPRLGARIDRALVGVGSARTVSVPTRTVRPAVTTGELAARYPAYIVVDRAAFRLRFYEHLKLAKTYEIAVGMEGLETPAGLHKIEWKQENPPWYVPNKAWAGALAGKVIPPGPEDPLKARFMSFDGGAGIHGIDPSEYSSIGHDASHGCVRMRIPDVIDLYSHTPVGTPVYIL
jgi:lipoprotein-anchoring transpeptidase ErfK/SrfK